jgi:hypothetical protein
MNVRYWFTLQVRKAGRASRPVRVWVEVTNYEGPVVSVGNSLVRTNSEYRVMAARTGGSEL